MTHHMADCANYAIAFQSDVYLITIKGSIFLEREKTEIEGERKS